MGGWGRQSHGWREVGGGGGGDGETRVSEGIYERGAEPEVLLHERAKP